ncbi:MAG: hypothetical protein P4L67_03650 [Candidatus Pacebacteria bacterium]|nr:hypothetical protein [Candidatus Paceibacterota bacterium]
MKPIRLADAVDRPQTANLRRPAHGGAGPAAGQQSAPGAPPRSAVPYSLSQSNCAGRKKKLPGAPARSKEAEDDAPRKARAQGKLNI